MRESLAWNLFRNAALALLALLVAIAAGAQAVTMAWSPVGSPGNVADTTVMDDGTTGYGSVAYNYRIGTYDVTNSQYVEFLNAKDAAGENALGLYQEGMSKTAFGGINYTAINSNGNKYSVFSGRGNHPVNFVTWYSAIRFANWMNNGQGNGDTETGAYTLLGGTPTPSNKGSITRNAGAKVFLPNENEWYKAAYYSPATSSYFQYPTSSNTAPIACLPPGAINSANYRARPRDFDARQETQEVDLTDVGAYTRTTSPFGAFDMGGNVHQWNETLFGFDAESSMRGLRGGACEDISRNMLSSCRGSGLGDVMTGGSHCMGFRLASIP